MILESVSFLRYSLLIPKVGEYPKAHSTGELAVITAGLLAVPGGEDEVRVELEL